MFRCLSKNWACCAIGFEQMQRQVVLSCQTGPKPEKGLASSRAPVVFHCLNLTAGCSPSISSPLGLEKALFEMGR